MKKILFITLTLIGFKSYGQLVTNKGVIVDSTTTLVSNWVTQWQRKKTSDSLQANINTNTTAISGKQDALSGTGILSFSGTTPSYLSSSGTGNVVRVTSPALVTPDLGTPSAAVLTSATGLPISTGVSGLATGMATFLATSTSANIKAAVTDETGGNFLVFNSAPTFTSNITTPMVQGGTGAGSSLELKSTTASGSSDFIRLLVGSNGATEALRVASSGRVGIKGITVPTASLHLPAGAAAASGAPLKFTSGTNLTTGEAGAMEYDGTNLFFTRSGTTRETVITSNAVNSVSPTAPNRTITVIIAGTTYYISAKTTND